MSKDITQLCMGDEFYLFNSETIDKEINNTSIGNYALLSVDENKLFIVKYVGRGEVKKRLKDHFKEYHDIDYFSFSYKNTEKEMVIEECRLYHYFKPIYNDNHPSMINNLECPYCK